MRALNAVGMDALREFARPDGEGSTRGEEEVYRGLRDEEGRRVNRVGGERVPLAED